MGKEITSRWTKFDRFAIGAVCLCLALVFLYLSLFCLRYTSIFNPENIFLENVLRQTDPLWANLLMMVCILAFSYLFVRFEKRLSLPWCTAVFLGLVFAAGSLWVASISALPRADSRGCFNVALALSKNQIPALDYYRRYPFQIGYTLYCEIFMRLFGENCTHKIGYANALFLTLSYAAILTITWNSKRSKRLQLYTIALSALCLQPIFYCTFIYGNLPGLAFALWGVVFAQNWILRQKWGFLPAAAVCCALAVVLKPNYWIVAVAALMVLFLYCLSTRRFRQLLLVALLAVLPLLFTTVVQVSFEARTGQQFGKGTPQSAWLAMGLQEGSRAAGWYNQFTSYVMDQSGFDPQLADQKSQLAIRERLAVFAADPGYGFSFFHNKMVSQWGETTFESLWGNKILKFTKDPPVYVQRLLREDPLSFIERFMDGYTTLVYLAFAIGLVVFAFKGRQENRPWAEAFGFSALAVTLFGGFLYHMLFEAKSQYLFIYLPMMIPFAALALSSLSALSFTRARAALGKRFKARS